MESNVIHREGSRGNLSRSSNYLRNREIWTRYHYETFLLTFFSYAIMHASRKTLSTVKPSLINVWTANTTSGHTLFDNDEEAEDFLSVLDSGFLAAYAVGLFFGGTLGDRYDPRIVLVLGMWTSSVPVFLFGMLPYCLRWYSKIFYITLWTLNGLLQSVGWPTEVCIMGNWFGYKSRGVIMGLWSACASVGNIMGTIVSSLTLQMGYQYAFAMNSLLLIVGGIITKCFLLSAPRNIGLPDPLESPEDSDRLEEVLNERPKPISFWSACCLPGVPCYSFAYACLKLVNYSFFFWLPFYLYSRFAWDESLADNLSIWYDCGGIIAAVIAGFVSDHTSSRTPIIISMLLSSVLALFAYSRSPKNILINSFLMTLTGFCIGGPANLISSAVSVDLGRAREIRRSAEALSTVTGIIDGTGSVGASLGQIMIPFIQQNFGWLVVFYCFMIMMFCTTLCLIPLLVREIKARRQATYGTMQNDSVSDDSDAPSPTDATVNNGNHE